MTDSMNSRYSPGAPGLISAIALVLLLCMAPLACANLDLTELGRILGTTGALDEGTVADGLREALTVGTERASASLSAPGGFADDAALRLALPDDLEPMIRAVRRMGLGGQVDALEVGMNRAAEAAAGEAVPVFADAIRGMTIADAFSILNGPDDAATQYFESKTSDPLRLRFEPVVKQSIERVGLYRTYKDLKLKYDALPFGKPVAPELEGYITDRTLSGLFQTLASEEAAIREDPAARTTALLKRVFGSQQATSR